MSAHIFEFVLSCVDRSLVLNLSHIQEVVSHLLKLVIVLQVNSESEEFREPNS
jgi:hypothetical protein